MPDSSFVIGSGHTLKLIPPDDPAFEWTGRIDWENQSAPVLIWQGTELRSRFTGSRIGLRFSDIVGQNCYNVIIDDEIFFMDLRGSGETDLLLRRELPEGIHDLVLYKRTEAFSNHAAFLGLLIGRNAEIRPRPPRRPLRFELYGDSITAGACNEDPGGDQYDDISTHNNYRSYGAITARNFGAEHVCIAVSGIGICESWDPRTMPEIFDKLYVDPAGRTWDWSGRQPDIVVINLGQNDHGVTRFNGRPFPSDFRERYAGLVRTLRIRYPVAEFFCVCGGMRCYRESPELRAGFDGAVRDLAENDPRLHSYVFEAFSVCHPRVDVHERMAEELTAFILNTLYEKKP